MRKTLLLSILLITSSLFSLSNWKTFTDCRNMCSAVEYNNKIAIATWGGITFYDPVADNYTKALTKSDGLSSNTVTCLNKLTLKNMLLVGTLNGVDIIKDNTILIPINQNIGLLSDNVFCLASIDSTVFVGTDSGLSEFTITDRLPIPMLVHNYNSSNGFGLETVNSLTITGDKYLYIGNSKGLDVVHTDSLYNSVAWHHYKIEYDTNSVTAVAFVSDTVYIGTEKGVYIANKNSIQNIISHPVLDTVSCLVAKGNSVYVTFGIWKSRYTILRNVAENAIIKLNNTTITKAWPKTDFYSGQAFPSLYNNGETLYALSWGGSLYVLSDAENWVNKENNTMILSNITDIAIDKKGLVWTCNGTIEKPTITRKGVNCYNGIDWKHYSSNVGELESNNIVSIEVDNQNRKWFGSYYTVYNQDGHGGLYLLDDNDNQENWNVLAHNDEIGVIDISSDINKNIWVSVYDVGLNVYQSDLSHVSIVPQFHNSEIKVQKSYIGSERIYFGSLNEGIVYWDGTDLLSSTISKWKYPDFNSSGLSITDITGYVYNGIEYVWFATSAGLYMFDGTSWYQYDIDTKIRRYSKVSGLWNDELYYNIDEDRLFGSHKDVPTTLYADPFGNLWIGSTQNGISVYNYANDRFTNYNMSKVPLASQTITKFAYNQYDGKMYIGTISGLNSVQLMDKNYKQQLDNTICYPNPFYPSQRGSMYIVSENGALPDGNNKCSIYDTNGDLIIQLKEEAIKRFSWDGKNKDGKECASGIYYYVVTCSNGDKGKGKIVLIR